MATSVSLSQRIREEFDAHRKRAKAAEQDREKDAQTREKRLEQFARTCESLKAIWRPRLEEFAQQFGDTIRVTPTITPTLREAKAMFVTDLANVTLTLTASASPDLSRLVLDYDLLILPMFLEYERHSRLEQPLDAVDPKAIAEWIDDRLIACVKVYLSLRDNQFYLNRAMVEDPISHTRFLPEDAKARCEHAGKAYYFSSEQTFQEFNAKHPPAPDAPPLALADSSPVLSEPKAINKPANAAGESARQ